MPDRARIFSRTGIGLCDLRADVERNWGVRGDGEAEFDLAYTDPNCREDFIRFGNWLLVESDKLEPWVGMIDVPREWKRRFVHVHAYTPERLFMYRNVPRQEKFNGKPGVIFRQILSLLNYAEPTLLQEGDIWERGSDIQEENLSGDHMLDYLTSLVERSGAEYAFEPDVQNGRLVIKANFSKRIGVRSNFPLEESYNLSDEDNCLSVQHEFTNQLWGYGNGAGQTDRPTALITDQESVDYYGLRQGSKVYTDFETPGAVASALKSAINDASLPHDVYKLSALDVGDTYANMRNGNSYPYRAWTIGFGISARVRVTGMYYHPERGKLDLAIREDVDAISE